MNGPWHYTTFVDFLDHWQGLIAGLVGFAAAIMAILLTLTSERRRSDRELEALRRSIGVELRQNIVQALSAHRSLRRLAETNDGTITWRMIQYASNLREPLIYPACAGRIGLLNRQAMDLVIVYNLLAVARDSIKALERYRTPDSISPQVTASIAMILMTACGHGAAILPRLRTKIASIDDKDQGLIEAIDTEAVNWSTAIQRWPELIQAQSSL